MNDSNLSIGRIIYEIMLLRLNLLPEYTYDEDEDERDIEEYREYYSRYINQCIEATDIYIKALQGITENPSSESTFNEYLQARRVYIKMFPFCYDELNYENEYELDYALKRIRAHHQNRDRIEINILNQCLLKYQHLLQQLIPHLPPKD